MDKEKLGKIVDFLFEVGMLAKTPRSGFYFLGSGEQSVAEHLNRTAYIGFILGEMAGDADSAKILQMCLFHDLDEARTSDLNYVHQKYAKTNEALVIDEHAEQMPFGQKIREVITEYEERESRESRLAKDADQIEFLLSLKEQQDIGNERAASWIVSAVKRMKTEEGKQLAELLITIDSDRWWYGDKQDTWWINRNKE